MDAEAKGLPKKPGRKPTKPGEWLKKRSKAKWRQESLPGRVVARLLEDTYGQPDDYAARAGGPADPWRQGGFGPVQGSEAPGTETDGGESVCPACQGNGKDEVGEPCAHCEGTGSHHDLEAGEDQLNDPGTDPLAGLEGPGSARQAFGGGSPPAVPTGMPPSKYGSRMTWRPEESLTRRLLR